MRKSQAAHYLTLLITGAVLVVATTSATQTVPAADGTNQINISNRGQSISTNVYGGERQGIYRSRLCHGRFLHAAAA